MTSRRTPTVLPPAKANGRKHIDVEQSPADTEQTRAAGMDREIATLTLRELRTNTKLNVSARLALGLFALASALVALNYVRERGDAMVQILSEPPAGSSAIGERLLALTIPVLLFTLFACLAGAAALVLHSRGLDETTRTLDALNRLKREGSVAVSARGLIFAFEEKLANARRAFMLQLWLGRTLFVVCLGIFGIALLNAIVSGVDLFTTILGGTSVAAALLSVSRGVPEKIGHHLADVIQIQTVVTGCDRQISLLESDAFAALNGKLDPADHAAVLEAQAQIDRVVSHAVKQIQRFADPGAT